MASICVWKGGETLKIPLTADRSVASAEGVPTVAVWLGGQALYAYASKEKDNAVIAFWYGGETYYLVTEHKADEVAEWELATKGIQAGTWTVTAEYANRPIKVAATGGKGSDGSAGPYIHLPLKAPGWAGNNENVLSSYSELVNDGMMWLAVD